MSILRRKGNIDGEGELRRGRQGIKGEAYGAEGNILAEGKPTAAKFFPQKGTAGILVPLLVGDGIVAADSSEFFNAVFSA